MQTSDRRNHTKNHPKLRPVTAKKKPPADKLRVLAAMCDTLTIPTGVAETKNKLVQTLRCKPPIDETTPTPSEVETGDGEKKAPRK